MTQLSIVLEALEIAEKHLAYVDALNNERDVGWSPDAQAHLARLRCSIGMLAAAPKGVV